MKFDFTKMRSSNLFVLFWFFAFVYTAPNSAHNRSKRSSGSDLFDAIDKFKETEAKELIKNGADLHWKSDSGYNLLHVASLRGYIDIVRILLDNNVDVNSKGGATPLSEATRLYQKDVAKLLIERGADVNMKVSSGKTALWYTGWFCGSEEMAKLLIDNNADVNLKDDYGISALDIASSHDKSCRQNIAEMLIAKGAEIDSRSNEGGTPLHTAVWNENEKGAELLLENRANIHNKNNNGKEPRDVAVEKNFPKLVKLLDTVDKYWNPWKACRIFSKLPDEYITGGKPAEREEFPWMAALGYDRGNGITFDCGGTIISEEFVLTAAHCVKEDYSPIIVRLGKLNLNDQNVENYHVKEIIRHSQYSRTTSKNDIALIRLKEEILFSYDVRPACLSTDLSDQDTETALITSGWGSTSHEKNTKSDVLLKTEVRTVPRTECNEQYMRYNEQAKHVIYQSGISESQYCAQDPLRRRDICNGDSGGPLQIFSNNSNTPHVIGIVSFGVGCGALPAVYTRVSHYLDWIQSHVWKTAL